MLFRSPKALRQSSKKGKPAAQRQGSVGTQQRAGRASAAAAFLMQAPRSGHDVLKTRRARRGMPLKSSRTKSQQRRDSTGAGRVMPGIPCKQEAGESQAQYAQGHMGPYKRRGKARRVMERDSLKSKGQ